MRIIIIMLLLLLFIAFSSFSYMNFDGDMTKEELECFNRCNPKNRPSLITDYGCTCETWLDFEKRVYPKRYAKRFKK